MNTTEIAEFLKANIVPLDDAIYGPRYRASARLNDGTYLPCVVFEGLAPRLRLAEKRLRPRPWSYKFAPNVLRVFVAGGNHVARYDLSEVESSPFAWPLELLKQIQGETAMGWTAFVAEMTDGTFHNFGTDFRMEFFDLPAGYNYHQIKRIHSGVTHRSFDKGLEPWSFESAKDCKVIRERPFFTCYLDEL